MAEIRQNFMIFGISAYFTCTHHYLLLLYLLSSLPAVAGVPAIAGALLLLLASSFMKALFAEVL
jgi:hypothetical protein